MSNLQFTDHAIDRFIQRHMPEVPDNEYATARSEIRAYLEEQAPTAVRLKQKTFGGQFLWKIGDYRIVTKRDNHMDVAVTILPQEYQRGFTSDELERIKEYQERLKSQEAALQEEKKLSALAEEEAKNTFLIAKKKANAQGRPNAAAAAMVAVTHEAWQQTLGVAVQTRKTVEAALELSRIETRVLKDWEKTVRHGMRSQTQDLYFRRMRDYLKAFVPEAAALVAEVDQFFFKQEKLED